MSLEASPYGPFVVSFAAYGSTKRPQQINAPKPWEFFFFVLPLWLKTGLVLLALYLSIRRPKRTSDSPDQGFDIDINATFQEAWNSSG